MQRQLDPVIPHPVQIVSNKRRLIGACSLLALVFLTPSVPGFAQSNTEQPGTVASDIGANLNITPKRLTLNRGQRSATVYIFNQGTAPATFDIAMVDRVMLPNGEIVATTEAARDPALKPIVDRLHSAGDMVVVAPRRAILPPGKGQTIRIRLSGPASGDAAEYRTHLTVMTVPPRSVGLTAEEAAAAEQSNQVSFTVATVFGVSIPVIVRPAPADVRAQVSNLRVRSSPDGKAAILSMDLDRLGASSVFGNIEVRVRGEKSPIAIARGVGVYPEIDKRSFEISLPRQPRSGEQLEILYIDDDTSPGRTIAKAILAIP